MKGSMVLDEVVFQIVDITLADGQVWLRYARPEGGVDLVVDQDAEITIFAPDGSLVFHQHSRSVDGGRPITVPRGRPAEGKFGLICVSNLAEVSM